MLIHQKTKREKQNGREKKPKSAYYKGESRIRNYNTKGRTKKHRGGAYVEILLKAK